MISSNLIFSKAAALRIMRVVTKIEAIRIFNGAVQITYRTKSGCCSTFLSKTAFFRDFVAFRYEGAKTVTVKGWGAGTYQNHYECRSHNGDHKHIVAVMNHLKYSSLEAYLDAKATEARESIFAF